MEIVIGGTVRTAIGRLLGALSGFRAPELGAKVIAEAVKRAGIDTSEVDEVIMGNVVTGGIGQNPARQAQILAGLDAERTNAFTVGKVCGSGMKAVHLAAQALKCGDARVIVAGGMESMSNGPFIIREARKGCRLGDAKLVDSMVYDGLWDYYNDFHMGMTGELVAERYGITREEADEFGYNSHRKAHKATVEGLFAPEILPIEVPQKKKPPIIFDKDEGVRGDTSLEQMAKLKPAFKKDGVVTAGNASQISDGAAAMVVTTDAVAKEVGMKVEARIIAYSTGAIEPKWVMLAPLNAVRKLLKKMDVGIDWFDIVEINEPFATATIALVRELEVPYEKLNPHGGAVALGHPIGCTGARMIVTLINALKLYKKKRGLAALCLGGGGATAIAIELL